MSEELIPQVAPSAPLPALLSRSQRTLKNFADFLRHVHRRWYLYLPVFALWGLAYEREDW